MSKYTTHLINHPLHQYEHNSRTWLMLPIVQSSRCEGDSFPHAAPQTSLISQSDSLATRLDGHQDIAMANCWPGTFRGNATPPPLGPPYLYIIVALSLHMCGTSGSTLFFKTRIPGIHSIISQLERKFVSEKHPLPKQPGYRTQGKCEEEKRGSQLHGKGIFASGKISSLL